MNHCCLKCLNRFMCIKGSNFLLFTSHIAMHGDDKTSQMHEKKVTISFSYVFAVWVHINSFNSSFM